MLFPAFLVVVFLPVLVNCSISQDKHQQPLNSGFTPNEIKNQDGDISFWKLNFSSEAPHYFASIYGLLQQWPNTFFPNGHVLAPGEIQPFTKFYHGHMGSERPESPEWLAFDIEMSYGIMGSTSNSHMLTYQTTRAVQVLYFDGESAALEGTGQLDSQMLHIYGNVTGPEFFNRTIGLIEEYARATGLCNWLVENNLGGVGWGFEGVVRMNAGFELIWCNFTSPSLRLISHLNITVPQLGNLPSTSGHNDAWLGVGGDLRARAGDSHLPLTTRTDDAPHPTTTPGRCRNNPKHEPFLKAQWSSWLTSVTKHYGSSGIGPRLGENRVKLTSCGILNYYSPEFRSQALARAIYEREHLNLTSGGLWMGTREDDHGRRTSALQELTRRRRSHRLDRIDARDAALMRSHAQRVLSDIEKGNQKHCSGADWHMITNEIVQVYAVDLMRLQLLLKSSDHLPETNYTAVREWMFILRAKTHALLLPFLQYPRDIADYTAWEPDSDLANKTLAQCRYHHTRLLVPGEGIPLGREEDLLRWAVEEVMGAICYVTQAVGFAVEKNWLTGFNDGAESPSKNWRWGEGVRAEVLQWTHGVEELMAWLGWAGEWVRCEKICAWDEECYLPMWPLKRMLGFDLRGSQYTLSGSPRCVSSDRNSTEDGPLDGCPRVQKNGGPWLGEDDEADLWQPKCVKPEYKFAWQ